MAHTKPLLAPLTCVVLLACGGCPTPMDIATRGYSELKGAQDHEQAISDINPAELTSHSGIELDRVVSGIGNLVSPDFVAQVASSLRGNLASLQGLNNGGTAIKIVAEITYYQAVGSIELLRGKQSVAVMHVTATTVDSRKVAEFLVVATTEALRTGDTDLAQALACGAAKYFQDRLPKRK